MRLKASVHRSVDPTPPESFSTIVTCVKNHRVGTAFRVFVVLSLRARMTHCRSSWNGSKRISLLPDDEVNIDAGVNSEVSDFLNHA